MMEVYYVNCKSGALLADDNNRAVSHHFTDLPFRIQKIILKHDSQFTQRLLTSAKQRLEQIRFNAANSSGSRRDEQEIRLKSFCGLIIEQLCFEMLTYYNKNPNIKIELDNSNSPIDQVDLTIHKLWYNKQGDLQSITKTVEVRSSFPFKSVEKSVAQDFDILGGYTNQVKTCEITKDFYLRFLFALDYDEAYFIKQNERLHYSKTTLNHLQNLYFDDELNLKQDLVIYFIGGATKAMMYDDSIAYDGNMTSANFNQNGSANYRKIKARNALDCIAIMQMMLNCITTELKTGK